MAIKQLSTSLTAITLIVANGLCFWLMWNFRIDGKANLFFLPEIYIVILAFNAVIYSACKKPQWATPVMVTLIVTMIWSSI